jgi:hypothetical protein
MKERLLMLALAAGALAAFYVLFFPKPVREPIERVLPLSNESGSEGYLAVWRWLGEQDIPAMSLRHRYDRLPSLLAQPGGNLLLVTMPQRVPMRAAELADLMAWVERGNTLLIMTALCDQPLWSLGADPLLSERLQRITGLDFTPVQRKRPQTFVDVAQALVRDRLEVRPRGAHPLLADVSHITALSALPTRRWQVRAGTDSTLALATLGEERDPALFLLRRGAGQIILSTVGSPFSNAAVALTDNARLLTNIIAWSRRPGGAVIFDDAHQGATAYYDGSAFFADARLHRTLGWIVLVWLAFVLGALPLRAAQNPWQPLDEAAYVEASARYFAAVVPPHEVAQRLIEDFLHELEERLKLGHDPSLVRRSAQRTSGASVWEWLETQAAVSPAQRLTLHDFYTSACAGKRVDLVRLLNQLAILRRNLE